MRRAWRVGYRTFRLAAATLARLGLAELQARRVRLVERPAIYRRHLERWAYTVLDAFRVRAVVAGDLPATPAPGGRIILANHRSFLDIPLFLYLFGGHHLSRADVAGWPVVGLAARRIETLFVDRADGRSGAAAVRALRRALLDRRTLIVFAEGGTFAGDQVRPFRAGALVAARGVPDVDVVPVGVAYPPGLDWHGLPFGAHLARTASRPEVPVGIAIGASRPAPRRLRGASADLEREVQALVDEARGAVGSPPPFVDAEPPGDVVAADGLE